MKKTSSNCKKKKKKNSIKAKIMLIYIQSNYPPQLLVMSNIRKTLCIKLSCQGTGASSPKSSGSFPPLLAFPAVSCLLLLLLLLLKSFAKQVN